MGCLSNRFLFFVLVISESFLGGGCMANRLYGVDFFPNLFSFFLVFPPAYELPFSCPLASFSSLCVSP